MRLRIGDRVKVDDNSGWLSGKEGILIPRKDIPLKESGVVDLPGHHNILQSGEVGVKQDDGNMFVIYLNRLSQA